MSASDSCSKPDTPQVNDVVARAKAALKEFEEARASDRAAKEPTSDTAWAGVELAEVVPELVAEVERLRSALGDAWDDGNGTGLDGWIGPGIGDSRGLDDEAVHRRDRFLADALGEGVGHHCAAMVEADELRGRAGQLRAFARDCVEHGDMTPAGARALESIADQLEAS